MVSVGFRAGERQGVEVIPVHAAGDVVLTALTAEETVKRYIVIPDIQPIGVVNCFERAVEGML